MVKFIILAFQALFQVAVMTPEEQAIMGDALDKVLIDAIYFSAIAIGIMIPVVLRTLNKRLGSMKENDHFSLLASYGQLAVQAAEQSIANGKPTEKFAYASKILAESATKHGMKFVTPDLITSVIESAVFNMKKSIEKKGG
jgi:glycerol dehydrogenase-like iron-containing ADH family enzyme